MGATILLAACFDGSAVEGLPCTSDEGCGPDHVCALGYCRAQLDDALAGCGDSEPAPGEWCYPLSRRFDLPLGDAPLRDVAWADLNGDGLVDALTISDVATVAHINLGGSFNTDLLEVRLTPQSLESLGLPEPAAELTLPLLGRRLALGNFVGSELPDVAFSLELAVEVPPEFDPLREAVEARLWLVENGGDTTSDPLPIPGTDPLGAAEYPEGGLQTGDFDGDGRDDLLVVTSEDQSATFRWLRGDSTGLQPPQPLPLTGAGSIVIADIDEDGRDDLLVMHRSAGVVSWLRGPLDALSPERFDLGSPTTAIHVGPIDDQPGLDLATMAFDTGTRTLWSWNGGGWTSVATQVGPTALGLTAGDLDGDGIPDLVTAGLDGVAVHSGFPGPTLGASFVIIDEPATSIRALTLDEDTAPDLVITDPRRVVVRLANP